MQAFIRGWLCCITAGLVIGCGGGINADSRTLATTQRLDSKTCLMQSNGVNILKVLTSTGIKCVPADGSLHFTGPDFEVEFWLVRGARTVDEASAQITSVIVDEFKDFKAEKTTDLTIADAPAKRLVGNGHEADDGDPGDADVIVFKVGSHLFIACSHGEELNPIGQQAMLKLVESAQAP